jgi:hypothetical protein
MIYADTHIAHTRNLNSSAPDVSFSRIQYSASVVYEQILFYIGRRIYRFLVRRSFGNTDENGKAKVECVYIYIYIYAL